MDFDVKTTGRQSVYDQFQQMLMHAEQAGTEVKLVIFNNEGLTRAVREDRANRLQSPFNGQTYCGLPWHLDHSQTEELVLSDKAKEDFIPVGASLAGLTLSAADLRGNVTYAYDGSRLTEAQVSDIVMSHCQPHIDAGTQTPLQRALHSAVVNFGRFE